MDSILSQAEEDYGRRYELSRCGYDLERIAVVLDLGFVTTLVAERLKGCDAIVLESNHDLDMLKIGPYPWSLKQRVKSEQGHLSNDQVAEFLRNQFDGGARHLVLAHLSEKNNLPELAALSAQQALEERSALLSLQTKLEVVGHGRMGETIRL